ncbi:hypothetical protein BDF20DRAFT_869086 [Mycotypha africana]|uniref:uncharacterized protein n=1 Tax=Mycotypha africana TaxID=64632 RepID=UPI002301383B|nr:uncharacterized protein BDF20DRAFT_869086 [Mycotypha africana]KAI8979351.1 hypothetical protein BDF20DRAFT_869086 [Mycotypha africana]
MACPCVKDDKCSCSGECKCGNDCTCPACKQPKHKDTCSCKGTGQGCQCGSSCTC